MQADINFEDAERAFLKERKEEFMHIDKNQDNQLELKELQVYFYLKMFNQKV
jgi:hypothetical protein